jgi:hypothetical protein
VVDPGIVDLADGDYRFRPGGEAAKRGLKSLDSKMAGLEAPESAATTTR